MLKLLESLPDLGEEMRDKTSRCAFYLSLLFKLGRQKSISRKCEYHQRSCGFCFYVSGEPTITVKCVYVHSWPGGRLSSNHSEQPVQNLHCGDF